MELSRRLIQAEVAERKRISRELHDETGQALMLLRLNLDVLANGLPSGSAKANVEESVALLDRTIEGLRRIIGRLSPRVLEELGLIAAIRKEVRQLTKQAHIKVQLSLPESPLHTTPETEIAIYRCVQEGLHNVSKHSEATNVHVKLEMDSGGLHLTMSDDGVGLPAGARYQSRGFGLIGIRERVVGLGGSVRVSSRARNGTRLKVVLPSDPLTPKREADANEALPALRIPRAQVPREISPETRQTTKPKARVNHGN